MFEIFIIFQKFSNCSKIFQNFAIFQNFQNLILMISVLTKLIGSGIAQEVYNKVNITFCFVQYHFYCTLKNDIALGFALCNIIFHCAIKIILHSTKYNITGTIIFNTYIISWKHTIYLVRPPHICLKTSCT